MTTKARRTFFIDAQTRERPGAAAAAAMGEAGANLVRMSALGLSVPQAIVLGREFFPVNAVLETDTLAELNPILNEQLRRLERATGLTYGGSRKPLLVAVRSEAPVAQSCTTKSVLNVGLNETTLRGLLRTTGNPRLAWDSYRRLIQSFAAVVDACEREPFDDLLSEHLEHNKVSQLQQLDARALSKLTRDYLALYRRLIGRNFPQDPMEQLRAAVHGVVRACVSARTTGVESNRNTEEEAGIAVTIQRMVFGNAGGTSGSGVACTRDPRTGNAGLHVEFTFNAQAKDAGGQNETLVDAEQLGMILPALARQLVDTACILEAEFKNMQQFEFVIQDEVLHLLHTRNCSRASGACIRYCA